MVLTLLLMFGLFWAGMHARRTDGLHPFNKEAVLPLRGILVLLVVAGHSLGAVDLGRYSLAFQSVAVFFFISGYGLMQKRLHANGNFLRGGFRHAVDKLVPTFLIASAAYTVYVLLRGGTVPLVRNIIEGSSNLPIPFTWYVPAIFALYGIFYLSDRICRKDRTMLVCVTIGVVFYWALTALVLKWPFYWWKAVGGFVAGLLFAANEVRLRSAIEKSPSAVYIVAALMFAGIYGLDCVGYFPIRFVADHLFLMALGPLVALVLYGIRIPKALGAVGLISYELYITHGAFVWNLQHAFSSRALYIGTIVICAVVAGVALKFVVKGLRLKVGFNG